MSLAKKNGNGTDSGLEEKLWAAADKLRSHMEAAEYKHIVLGLIFLKYISDASRKYSGTVQREFDFDAEDQTTPIFCIPDEACWSYIQSHANKPDIGVVIDRAMVCIERENVSLKDVLPKDYSRPSLDTQRLGELVHLVSTIGLADKESRSRDILGRVYEYFLGRFASTESKSGGEFYTPQSVVRLLVAMVEPYKGCVYDPCCGSGGIFVQSEKFVLAHGGRKEDLSVYGQELNTTTWRLCKMNLAIRGINGNIGPHPADTFHNDLHKDLKADFILANPPFNISDWGGERLRKDSRWQYGIPPAASANFAWVQHMVYHLAPGGFAGFVLTNGSLSTNQDREEGEIRKALIEADLVDCIVALPPQLFYNTQIASCLWFLAQSKKDARFRDRKGQTLFIYAHQCGKMIDRTHRELTDAEIEHIATTYHRWRSKERSSGYKDIPGFCASVPIDEIRNHNWALVPGRYVGFDETFTQQWDNSRLHEELTQVEARLQENTKASEAALTILKEIFYGPASSAMP